MDTKSGHAKSVRSRKATSEAGETNFYYRKLIIASRPTISYENAREKFNDTRKHTDPSTSSIFSKIPHSFWDVLKEDLRNEDSQMRSAINLLTDVKNRILALLSPANLHMKNSVEQIFDEKTMRSEAENGNLDLKVYVTRILRILENICTPKRESEIRELLYANDAVAGLKSIIDIIGEMKMDMGKYSVQPAILPATDSTIYSNDRKMTNYLINLAVLPQTKSWLKKYYTPSLTTKEILINAFLDLVVDTGSDTYAETLMMHVKELESLKSFCFQLTVSTAGVLTLFTHLPNILCTSKVRQQYYSTITNLVEGIKSDSELGRLLPELIRQVRNETTRKLREHKDNSLTETLMRDVSHQLNRLPDPTYKVRRSVKGRIYCFLKESLLSEGSNPVPHELKFISSELTELSVRLIELVRTNVDQCVAFYDKILADFEEEKNSDGKPKKPEPINVRKYLKIGKLKK